MKIGLAYWILIGGAMASVAGADEVPPPEQAVRAGFTNLVFHDDFNTFDLSPDGQGAHNWYSNLWYQATAEPKFFDLKSGVLTLTSPSAPDSATSIATVPHKFGRRVVFNHGYFEARLKWPSDANNFAAFWLLSDAHAQETDHGHWCEIDIYESFRDNLFLGTVHDWAVTGRVWNPNNYHWLEKPIAVDSWNVYGLLWEPGKVTWYLNNVAQMSATVPEICESQELFLIIGAQKRGGAAAQTLSIDWVRVFGPRKQ